MAKDQFSLRDRSFFSSAAGPLGLAAALMFASACTSEELTDGGARPDASISDSGAPDSGTPDSGTPDAGAPSTIEIYAGGTGGIGNLDGPRRDARFAGPSGVVRTADGTFYIADSSNYVIRKISPAGEVTTLAGKPGVYGSADGKGETARFALPVAIALAPDGALIVSDTLNASLRRVLPDGTVTTYAGRISEPGGADGPLTTARFRGPEGLAYDASGALFVADREAHTIRRIAPDGEVTTYAGSDLEQGSTDGPRAEARFMSPFGITVGADGKLAISDSGNNTIRIIDTEGTVTTLAGTPGGDQDTTDGTGPEARFGRPRALVFDAAGDLLVFDTFNDRIRKITPEGVVTTWAGSTAGSLDGPLTSATFSFPTGVWRSEEEGVEVLYVTETGSSIIRHIREGVVTTFAGAAAELVRVDGPALDARFAGPAGMLAREDGSVLIADSYNHSIRRIAADGTVESLAGHPDEPDFADGPLAVARFSAPRYLLDDGAGGYYVSDSANHLIRHVSAEGEVTTFAGGPLARGQTHADGPRRDARFVAPAGIVRDSTGVIYFIDAGNHMVRKIDLDGMVTTVAGEGVPGHADGALGSARFNAPDGLALVDDNTLIVADALNDVLRKVDLSAEVVSTFAGQRPINDESRPGWADGVGTAASFRTPRFLLKEGDSLLVSDSNNSLIRRVSLSTAEVTTVAGERGRLGIRAGTLPGVLYEPQGLLRLADGSLLVTHLTGILKIRGIE